MPTSKNISSNKNLRIIAFFLIGGGLLILYLLYAPLIKEEIKYRARQVFVSQKSQKEKGEIKPVDQDFGLVIPKIAVNSPVFANIDPTDPKEYLPILVKGVAHSKGSALPGQPGNVFIFAHSSDTPFNIVRYNAVFYLLSKLQKDDEIFLYYQQEKYRYQVLGTKILSPENLESYVKTLKGNTLTLQTCYPPGTTLKRLIVVAQLKEI